jgi:micrococcal nuclease
MMNDNLFHYKALITAVYDGDTVTAEVDLGFRIKITERFRLLGINTPELRGDEREKGLVSRDAVRQKILGKQVTIKTKKDKKGKYGRYLGTIFLEEEEGNFININEWIVENDYGVERNY